MGCCGQVRNVRINVGALPLCELSAARWYAFMRKGAIHMYGNTPPAGLEPAIFGFEGRRLVHEAKGAVVRMRQIYFPGVYSNHERLATDCVQRVP